MRAENYLLESVRIGHKPRSAFITATVARLSQIPAALLQSPSTARENEGRAVLHSSDPALMGLREKLGTEGG